MASRRAPATLALSTVLLGGCLAEPQALTGGDVSRATGSDGQIAITARSTGDVCGPPPVNVEQKSTVDLDAKVLEYVKAGGKVETLNGIKQILAGADLGCDAVMYRACKICFATQNGQGCMALTTNALAYCQQRTGGPGATTITPVSAPAPASPPTPPPAPPVADSPPILRLVLSLWTDTDDKDKEESVSVRILYGQDIVGTGGPWGGGETWGDQENRNNGQPHVFVVPLTRTFLLRDVGSLRMEIIKTQAGGRGGKGWHVKPSVIAETPLGRTEVWRSPSTIKLGNGHSPVFATDL